MVAHPSMQSLRKWVDNTSYPRLLLLTGHTRGSNCGTCITWMMILNDLSKYVICVHGSILLYCLILHSHSIYVCAVLFWCIVSSSFKLLSFVHYCAVKGKPSDYVRLMACNKMSMGSCWRLELFCFFWMCMAYNFFFLLHVQTPLCHGCGSNGSVLLLPSTGFTFISCLESWK